MWFEENLELNTGFKVKVKCNKHLETINTEFQKIDIYNTESFGRMLVHDNVIMLTESDEPHYHEMISHVALNSHPNPKSVLIIGGGDGGTIREVAKHKSVESIDLCEIDKGVVDICVKHFPNLTCSIKDPRVSLYFEDGAEFVKKYENHYDVIIVDSSDPIGPAEVLFQKQFYQSMYKALTENGIVVTQSESFHFNLELIGNIAEFSREIFPLYKYFFTTMPTYPSGMIGFSFCSKGADPINDFNPERAESLEDLKYYTAEIHKASFVLPKRIDDYLNKR